MEDLSNGVSITDLTLTDFRIDLAQYLKEHPGQLDSLPLGSCAVTTSIDADIPPGIIFCLRAEGAVAAKGQQFDYPLAPIYLAGDLVSASLFGMASGAASDTREADTKADSAVEHAFAQSLTIARQPQTSLHALYQGWMDCVQALQAARRTGNYQTAATPEQAAARRQALADCERLANEIARLRALAAKEKQMARQVELNLALKHVKAELAAARGEL